MAPFILKFFLRIFLVLCIFLFLCFLLIFEFQIESFSPKPLFIIQSPYPIGNPSVVRPQTDEARGGTGRKRHTDRVSPSAQRNTETFLWTKKNSLDYHLFASRNQQRGKNEGDDNDNLVRLQQRRHSKNSRVPCALLCVYNRKLFIGPLN